MANSSSFLGSILKVKLLLIFFLSGEINSRPAFDLSQYSKITCSDAGVIATSF
jgi:hypothetical protein